MALLTVLPYQEKSSFSVDDGTTAMTWHTVSENHRHPRCDACPACLMPYPPRRLFESFEGSTVSVSRYPDVASHCGRM
jgi:hypothetical protein